LIITIKIPLDPPFEKGELANSPLFKRGVSGDLNLAYEEENFMLGKQVTRVKGARNITQYKIQILASCFLHLAPKL
jgi:hypothetical protein